LCMRKQEIPKDFCVIFCDKHPEIPTGVDKVIIV